MGRTVPNPVRLVVVDVDGCLTPGEGKSWNWRALQFIQAVNRRARKDESVPAVTLCTGRQEPYVEALMQAIGAYLPGIYENGCGLYIPGCYRFIEHPAIASETHRALIEAKAILHRKVIIAGLGYFQPGKEASLTLYPLPGVSVTRLFRVVANVLVEHGTTFTVQASISCVDVTPAGIDKGSGVRWLAEETSIPLLHMGGVGDSTSDLAFLRLVGRSAAPANAAVDVKAAVGYTSAHGNGDGVVDILRRWISEGSAWEVESNE